MMRNALRKLGSMYIEPWARAHKFNPDDFGGSAEINYFRWRVYYALLYLTMTLLMISVLEIGRIVFLGKSAFGLGVVSYLLIAAIIFVIARTLYSRWFKNPYYSLKLYLMWKWKRDVLKRFEGFYRLKKTSSEDQLRKIIKEKLEDLAVQYFHRNGSARQRVFQEMIEMREVAVDCKIDVPRVSDFLRFSN